MMTRPFSSSIARLQYSLTQAMSWVTRTMPLAAFTSSITRVLRLLPELGVARGKHLVEQQDVRVDRGRDREPEPRAHARRVRLDRRIDELAEVRVLDDRRQQLAHEPVVEAHERAGQQDVLAAAQVLVEARAERQQARDVAVDLDRSPQTAG